VSERHAAPPGQHYGFRPAHRFYSIGKPHVAGTVYQVWPTNGSWEATVDGTDIKVVAESRSQAVEEALRQAAAR
jgi:hypothetical protein